MNINFLRIPLFHLYSLESANDFRGLSAQELNFMRRNYDKEELSEIREAVKWAAEHPDFDFSSLLPDLKQSNEDIYRFLCVLSTSLGAIGLTDAN